MIINTLFLNLLNKKIKISKLKSLKYKLELLNNKFKDLHIFLFALH